MRRRKLSKTTTVAVLAVLAVGWLAGCSNGDSTGDNAQDERVVTVESALVEEREWRVVVRSVGTLNADEEVVVRTEVAGIVQDIPGREGASVDRGDVLVRIDDERATFELERASAQYDQARATRDRREKLFADKLITEEEWLHVQADYRRAAAERGLARRNQQDTRIRAPLPGVLGQRQVALGDYVAVGTPLFHLVKVDELTVLFHLPERYLSRVQTGQRARVHSPAHPDERFEGEVDFIDPLVQRSTRTLTVRARLPNPAGLLKPNQFVEVELDLETLPAALVVPEEAIISDLGEFLCYVIDDDSRAQIRTVELGEREPGWVQVLSGVEAGERVVAVGHQRLQPGTRVRDRNNGDDSEG